MAGLYSCNSQDTFERKEYDGNASEMMKEGDIRRWEMHHPSCPFFSPATFIQGKGFHCHVLFSQVLFVSCYVSLVLHSPVALLTGIFLLLY